MCSLRAIVRPHAAHRATRGSDAPRPARRSLVSLDRARARSAMTPKPLSNITYEPWIWNASMTDILFNREERIPIAIEKELKRSYLDYAMSVIIGRALPDVRDGLKPVHRRILYGMWEQGCTAGKPYRKSARIVGDVMGKYHPHGDAAIYDTLVRMAQPFSMRHMLVDGQGNFGSVDGDSAAAMRYTEVRLARLTEEMLGDDLGKETVEWIPNYDGSLKEPVVLPAKFPNLLVNGSSGHRGRDGDQHPAAQPRRGGGRLRGARPQPRHHPRRADQADARPGLPDRRHHPRHRRDPRGVLDRPRLGADAGARPHRAPEEGRARRHHRQRAAVPGEQGAPGRAHRRAGAGQGDRRDRGPARRVRPRRHPGHGRAQARRGAAGRVEPALQDDPDAVELRDHLPRHRGQPAAGADAAADARLLHRAPQGSGHAADALRAGARRGAGPHPGRARHRPRPPRRRHQDDPRRGRPAVGEDRA